MGDRERHRHCPRGHEEGLACSCEMGNLYRFCEPIVLLSLARLGPAHGYQLAAEAEKHTVTHSELDAAAVYRSLRRLEANGHVTSTWDTSRNGPARRMYTLTPSGWEHLREWEEVIAGITSSLQALVQEMGKVAPTAESASTPVGGA